jgi:ATP-binding cassette subfamily B multidrug efflux pump
MRRLLKYLKPYTLFVLSIIVLLFVQANADLSLPDYMSRIVNVGIQQGGVEEAVPRAMRAATLDHLLLFLTDQEKADVQAQYVRVDSSSPDYDALVKKYPALAQGPIYVLRAADPAALERIQAPVARALIIVSGIETVQAHPNRPRR